jgi:chromosome segregation ATPase
MTEKAARLSPEEIFEVADALYVNGEAPTTVKVFQRLGRGSMTTIQKYLKEWRPREGVGGEESRVVEIPAEVRDVVGRFALEMWRRLHAVTQGELDAVRKNAADEVAQVKGEFMELAEMVDNLRTELGGTAGERDTLREEVDRLKAELQEVKGKNSELQARLTSAIDEKFRFQEEVRDLDRALSKTRERVSTLEGRVENLTSENLLLETDLNQRIEELARSREEREQARGEVLAATKVEENLRRELSKEEGRGRELSGNVDELSRRLTEEAAQRAALEERLLHLEGK